MNIPREQLEVDGSLRDIYVYDTSPDDWNRFLSCLQATKFGQRVTHGERLISLSSHSFASLLELRRSDPVLLQLDLGHGVYANCHFFCAEQIELDVDPRQLKNSIAVSSLTLFLTWLAESLGRSVYLTHENAPDLEIARVGPDRI